jgi:poly(3-hydroxybutyrate) depolymerase
MPCAKIRGTTLIAMFLFSQVALAEDWPPTQDRTNPITESLNGRRIERYTHGARVDWGYPENSASDWQHPNPQETTGKGQNHNSFYVVFPKSHPRHAPLCVALHSANRTGFDYLGYQFLNRRVEPSDDPSAIMTPVLDNCYVLYLNSTDDEWWGWKMARDGNAKYLQALTPAEKRVLDTIEWVIQRYKIDRNRVYLSGVSMGGCGALGIGLPHGNIFAAIMVDVPAGTDYAALRLGFPRALASEAAESEREAWIQKIPGTGLPDPPVVMDFSAQNDSWSKTQLQLLRAAQAGKLPLVVAWGPFGHTAFSTSIAQYPEDDVALSFPWLEIRKNVAYPVFTNTSSDQRSPWSMSSTSFDESGQINAYFRWSNERDKTSRFAMKLWLSHPNVTNPPSTMPEVSTTDITLRRLQRFKVQPGKAYTWRLVRESRIVESGRVRPNAANLITIPQVTLNAIKAELIVEVLR